MFSTASLVSLGVGGSGSGSSSSSVVGESTIFIKDSHSSFLFQPKSSSGANSGGGSWTEGSLWDICDSESDRECECVEWETEEDIFHSGDNDLWEGRIALESNDVERTAEKRMPSSATVSSPENPPHSSLLFRSMGVPRPAYLISGHEPRVPEGVVDERFGVDAFLDCFEVNEDTRGDCEANDMERESMGEEGGEGVDGGKSDVDGTGDEGAERQDKSKSKSVKTSKMEVSMELSIELSAGMRIVSSSSSSSFSGTVIATCCAAAMTFDTTSERVKLVKSVLRR